MTERNVTTEPKSRRSNADRQRDYRARRETKALNFDRLETALIEALDAGRAHKLADNLPEEPNARCDKWIRRLSTIALVVFPPRIPRT